MRRRATQLTDAFVGAYRDPDARPEPFFDPAGQELVSHLLRAAALDGRPITQAPLWSTRPNDDEPARILQDHGLELAAASLLDNIHSPFEQRGGVYSTARQILSFLRDPDVARLARSPLLPGLPLQAWRHHCASELDRGIEPLTAELAERVNRHRPQLWPNRGAAR